MRCNRLLVGAAIGAVLGCGGGRGSAGHPAGAAGAVGGGGGGAGSGGAAGAAGASGAGGSAGATGGSGGTAPIVPLDMNDVTILAPMPQSTATPVLLRGSDLAEDGTALVPRALLDRLVIDPSTGRTLPTLDTAYDRLQLVAVRFDLCDRHLPGACPDSEDARMRLVFQPMSSTAGFDDVGFHAFYTIRNDEIAGAIAALRDLAMTAPPQTGALRVSPALGAADPEPYATKLRAFVRRYGGDARILRLTINTQNLERSIFTWMFRGVEKQGNAFVDITIAGGTGISEMVVLSGDPSFTVMPVTDSPLGLLGAITQSTFDGADAPTKRAYLGVLAAVDNPMSHTAETVPCVACHVSTVVMNARTASAAIDPLTLPGRYTSTHDLSIAGGQSAETQTSLRALGYRGNVPLISQRVVNDTAQTLTEIDTRFPGPI